MTQQIGFSGEKYETVAKIDGVSYEIVDTGQISLFGKPILLACTFREVMVPSWQRETLGTYMSRADALAKLKTVIPNDGEPLNTKEG